MRDKLTAWRSKKKNKLTAWPEKKGSGWRSPTERRRRRK
jgi:hypothetical protein